LTNEEKIRQYSAEEVAEQCRKWAKTTHNFACTHQEIIDALNAIPHTSFLLTPEEIKALLKKVGDE